MFAKNLAISNFQFLQLYCHEDLILLKKLVSPISQLKKSYYHAILNITKSRAISSFQLQQWHFFLNLNITKNLAEMNFQRSQFNYNLNLKKLSVLISKNQYCLFILIIKLKTIHFQKFKYHYLLSFISQFFLVINLWKVVFYLNLKVQT